MLWVLAGLALAGLLCIAYGVFIERKSYRLVRRALLPILPAQAPDELTILHLSDLHFVRKDPKKTRFLSGLPRADITVVTGDFLAEPEAVETAVEAVRAARGRLASFFVLGSNDIFVPGPLNPFRYFRRARKKAKARSGRSAELIAQLEGDGWMHLGNDRRMMVLGDLPLEVAGMNDPHIHFNDIRPLMRHAQDRLGIALAHAPDPAPELVALGYDLVVSGHTHGGQVRAPWGALVNNSTLPLSMTVGLFRLGSGYLHISQGLGTSKYAPFRFLCPPQAEMLELGRRLL